MAPHCYRQIASACRKRSWRINWLLIINQHILQDLSDQSFVQSKIQTSRCVQCSWPHASTRAPHVASSLQRTRSHSNLSLLRQLACMHPVDPRTSSGVPDEYKTMHTHTTHPYGSCMHDACGVLANTSCNATRCSFVQHDVKPEGNNYLSVVAHAHACLPALLACHSQRYIS